MTVFVVGFAGDPPDLVAPDFETAVRLAMSIFVNPALTSLAWVCELLDGDVSEVLDNDDWVRLRWTAQITTHDGKHGVIYIERHDVRDAVPAAEAKS